MPPFFGVTCPTTWVQYSIACGQGQACAAGVVVVVAVGLQMHDEGTRRAMQPSRRGQLCLLEYCSQQGTSVWFTLTRLTTTKAMSRINCFSTQLSIPS